MQRPASFRSALAKAAFWLLFACCDNGTPQLMSTAVPAPAGFNAGAPTSGSGGMPAMAMQPDARVQAIADAGEPMPPMATDAMVQVMDEDDAGPWIAPDPQCVDGEWRLAPGFLLARKVDYVADRTVLLLPSGLLDDKATVLSSAGIPCVSATNKANCLAALELPATDQGRHLITTAGDSVRLWNPGVAGNLLGLIDTKSDAIWWALSRGAYLFPCDVRIEAAPGGFNVFGALSTACGPVADAGTHKPLDLWISERGEVLERGLEDPNGFLCGPTAEGGMGFGGMGGGAGGLGGL
jgi:hypothetical protein